MIQSRTLSGDNFGNEMRYRVIACRKRLRFSRTIHRRLLHIQEDEQSREIETRSTRGRESPGLLSGPSSIQEEAEST